jgi:hypothetical protein
MTSSSPATSSNGVTDPPAGILSQLAFDSEPDMSDMDTYRYSAMPWHGIFCPATDDEEVFFDTLEYFEDHDEEGNMLDRNNAIAIRGGYNSDPDPDSCGSYQPPSPPPPRTAGQGYTPPQLQPATQGYTPPSRAMMDASSDFTPLCAPRPPTDLPLRFLRAGKGDPVEGRRRYEATLQWRNENRIDAILQDAHPQFELIKRHYPHFYHLRGRNNEPVFFELPPKVNLQAMREGGVDLKSLLHHYAMVTEFQWQHVERDDFAVSITVLDLEGVRMMDFVGECVDYVRKSSDFTGQHFPERAGCVLVINVPGWFRMIWKVVEKMIDEVTLRKIRILRGKEEIFNELLEKIPIENIPPQYGGQSMPLGQSPQEDLLRNLMRHNNNIANGDFSCGGRHANCPFCTFVPIRSY